MTTTSTTGQYLTIYWTQDAEDSFREMTKTCTDPKTRGGLGNIAALIQRLADQGRLRSPDQFNAEGDGFHAIKHSSGIRAYGWFEDRNFILSHFILKKQDKLAKSDQTRMQRNRDLYRANKLDRGTDNE